MSAPHDQIDDARHADNQDRFAAMERKLDNLSTDTQELLDLFRAARGGLKVMGWVGGLLKWTAAIAASCAAIYAFIQNLRGH